MGDINELINKLAQDRVAVNAAPHPYVLSLKWIGGAAAYILVSLALSGLRPDIVIKLHDPWYLLELAALLCILVTTSLSASLLSFPDQYQSRRLVFSPIATFTLFILVMIFAWHADSPPAPLPLHSFECTVSIALFSLMPAGWTMYVIRQFASTHLLWAGSIALLFAFSVGALWLRLHEVNNSITHVIEWHYLPMIAVGIIGLWLGKVVLKW